MVAMELVSPMFTIVVFRYKETNAKLVDSGAFGASCWDIRIQPFVLGVLGATCSTGGAGSPARFSTVSLSI